MSWKLTETESGVAAGPRVFAYRPRLYPQRRAAALRTLLSPSVLSYEIWRLTRETVFTYHQNAQRVYRGGEKMGTPLPARCTAKIRGIFFCTDSNRRSSLVLSSEALLGLGIFVVADNLCMVD